MKKVKVTVKYMKNGNVKTLTYNDALFWQESLYPEAVLELAGFIPEPSEYPLVDSIEITLAHNSDRGAIIKCDKRESIITIYPKYWEDVPEFAIVLQYENNNSLKRKISDIEDAVYKAINKPSDRQISLKKACLANRTVTFTHLYKGEVHCFTVIEDAPELDSTEYTELLRDRLMCILDIGDVLLIQDGHYLIKVSQTVDISDKYDVVITTNSIMGGERYEFSLLERHQVIGRIRCIDYPEYLEY